MGRRSGQTSAGSSTRFMIFRPRGSRLSRWEITIGRPPITQSPSGGGRSAPPIVTTLAGAYITRCLTWQADVVEPPSAPSDLQAGVAYFLPGVPHHALCTYAVQTGFGWTSPTRLRHTASYTWLPGAANAQLPRIDRHSQIGQLVDAQLPALSAQHDLHARWTRWHRRAEASFQYAAAQGRAECLRKAERPKGSAPTVRPIASSAQHRPSEPIALRRIRRLHRRLAERVRQRTPLGDHLAASDAAACAQAARDGTTTADCSTMSYADALASLSETVRSYEAQISDAGSAAWRRTFRDWSHATWRSAKPIMRDHQPAASFTATEMAEDWRPTWCPPDFDDAT